MAAVKNSEVDLLILGAGWSGLLAAFLYSREKKGRVLVLEKELFPGGLARTMDIQGLKADIGGHALFFKKNENLAVLKDIAPGQMLLSQKRKARIYIDGRYLHYPADLDFVWNCQKKYLLGILWDFLKPGNGKKPSNFEDWVRSNYGDTLYEIVFKEYSRKVWGQPCSRLSYSWAGSRIGRNGLAHFFFKHFLKDGSVKERAPSFYYPQQGVGALVEGLLSKMGPDFQMMTGVSLNSFSNEGERLSALQYSSQDAVFEVKFRQIISTVPLTELVPVLPGVPSSIAEGARQGVRYRSLMIVYLVIDSNLVSDWSWCYFPSEKLVFSRIHEPKFWSASLAPEGKTLLSVEIFCDYMDRTWTMDDALVISEVLASLKEIGLPCGEGFFIHGQVSRVRHAYPLPYCGFEAALSHVTDYLKSHVNLHLAGRSGTHSYFDMEDCLDDVRKVVRRVIQDGG